jgi:RecJ-like exonuclease
MIDSIKLAVSKLEELSKIKPIKIVSHFDTDGITSAAIFSKALSKWHKPFTMQIVKNLEENIIKELPESHILIFLDLASNSLEYLKNKKTDIFILDHHEIIQEIPKNVTMINPHLSKSDNVSTAAICYLFAKELGKADREMATLSIMGMIGDCLERDLVKTYNEIIKESETIVKKGLLIYPSTRPLDRTLEYSSQPYIPGVTGSFRGVLELLRDSGISKTNGDYKSLSELTEQEMSNLVTSIALRTHATTKQEDLIGNLFLVKFFNKLEDARELSALINACSRMGFPQTALGLCLGNKNYKQEAEKIYVEYKQQLISGLRLVQEMEKISGNKYAIINAKGNIKDTIIGTIASIISRSPIYEQGTMIIALAYNEDKIKVSARIAGNTGKNVREILNQVVVPLGGEVGGHPNAAGCLISKENEELFILELKKVLEQATPTQNQ